MIKTEVTRVLGLPGFAPADESAYANRQEQYRCTNRKASMKRIIDALGKVNWEKRRTPLLCCAQLPLSYLRRLSLRCTDLTVWTVSALRVVNNVLACYGSRLCLPPRGQYRRRRKRPPKAVLHNFARLTVHAP